MILFSEFTKYSAWMYLKMRKVSQQSVRQTAPVPLPTLGIMIEEVVLRANNNYFYTEAIASLALYDAFGLVLEESERLY